MEDKKRVVCVTGAGGFISSWLVKLLLSQDYIVHGTVRDDPADVKYDHVQKLEKAAEKLKLFKADLMDYKSLFAAIRGCNGVFHVASPVPTSTDHYFEEDLVKPAVTGTLNVMRACTEASVERVVVVSSAAAVLVNPNWPQHQEKDENCWSDKDFCKAANIWYAYAKTVAESEAVEYGERTGLDVVTLCPVLVWGPMLHKTTNISTMLLINLLKGGGGGGDDHDQSESVDNVENRLRMIVDVRDLVEALLLVYTDHKPQPAAPNQSRYICSAHPAYTHDLLRILNKFYPNYNSYPISSFTPKNDVERIGAPHKLLSLGWKYRPLEETLVDAVESYKQLGLLN